MNQIDLHTHSTKSDGTLTPRALVRAASEIGLSAIALTDHDTIDGLEEAQKAGEKYGVRVIPGIEMSVSGPVMVHILGIGIDQTDQTLKGKLADLKTRRNIRNVAMVEKLKENGFSISIEDLPKETGKSVTRAHIGRALVEKGYAATIKEACIRYLLKGKVGYVSASRYTSTECIELIHHAGGKAILCHINQIKLSPEELDELVAVLAKEGLDGIEVYYSEYDDFWTERAKVLADRHGLLYSGGSDFHGENKDIALGAGYGRLFVPEELLDKLYPNS